MTDLSKLLLRSLLVLSLAFSAVACGDDDGDDDVDSGIDAGGDGDGDSGTDAGLTEAQCIDMTDTNTGGAVSAECAQCTCGMNPDTTAACDATCWGLLNCIGASCGDVADDETALMTCVFDNCISFLTGIEQATAFGPVIRACSSECITVPTTDSGTTDDAGN